MKSLINNVTNCLLCCFFLSLTTGCRQNTDSEYNLNFEFINNGMPSGWQILYEPISSVSLDSIIVKSGKYSISIENEEDCDFFQMACFVFPRYTGKNITVSGYVKTEDVRDGWAGLVTEIHPFANNVRQKVQITGTTGWKKYEITIDEITQQTHQLIIGVVLTGKGKMWMDDIKVTVDGKNIGKVKPYKPVSFSEKAENDNEFNNGSFIVFPELTAQKIKNLELLGRIWGLLKYHHPAISRGNYNLDFELFRILPDYLNITDSRQRDEFLIAWLNKFGRIPNCKTCKPTNDNAFLKPDLAWIDNSNVSLNLRNLLHKIYLNRSQGAHYYFDTSTGPGNPNFTNEKAYANIYYPDDGYRLLALYRFWNMIHYFFPYKHLTDKDWNSVLKEYIPTFIKAKTRYEYEL